MVIQSMLSILDELKMLCISFAAPDFAHFSGPSGYAKFLAKAYVGGGLGA